MTPLVADVGVTMIFVQMQGMMFALIPIILVESLLVRRSLSLTYRDAFRGITIANLASTIVGVPLAWLAMLILQYAIMLPVAAAANYWHWQLDSPVFGVLGFLVSIAWLWPSERYLFWMIPAASALLLIPSFVASVWLERSICTNSWTNQNQAAVRRSVFNANLLSYGLLFLIACGWLAFRCFTHS